MKLVKPSYEILSSIDDFLKRIELVGRLCYKSEDKITDDSAEKFVSMLLKKGHGSVVEHAPNISVKFIANRGFTHEIVRHRLASHSQESTRYCNYGNDKFDNELTFCMPEYIEQNAVMENHFKETSKLIEHSYLTLINNDIPAQIARDILPIGIKAEIIVTANVREWRHILKLRTEKVAHPIMLELMRPLCKELQSRIPVLFDDVNW